MANGQPLIKRLNQTGFFLITFGLGALGILLGKLVPVTYYVLGIGLPVLLMIAYAVLNHRYMFLDSTRTQVADNAYFLGFLYFLVSLAITLAQVTAGTDLQHRIEVEPIIRGFGIALITTICGLAIRIVLLQDIAGLTSAREKAEESLLRAVNTMHDKTIVAVDMLAKARDAALSSTQQTVEQLADALTRTIGHVSTVTQEATTAYSAGLSTAAKKATDELNLAVESLRAKILAMELPADALTSRLQPAIDSLQASLTGMSAAASDVSGSLTLHASQTRKVQTRLEKLLESLTQYTETFGKLLATMGDAAKSSTELQQQLAAASASSGTLATSVNALVVELQRTPQVAQTATAGLAEAERTAQTLRNSATAMVSSIASDMAGLAEALRSLRSEAQQMHATTEAGIRNISAELRGLRAERTTGS